jgi:hypothetical protein
MKHAGVAKTRSSCRRERGHRAARTKPEIALAEIDRVIAFGVRFGCVLADSGYGSSGPFRQALSERGLLWAVGLSRRQNVYPAEIALIFPIAKIGKPRKYHIPDQPPVSAEALLAEGKWQRVSWRRGTKGRLTCLFTARRVRVADGVPPPRQAAAPSFSNAELFRRLRSRSPDAACPRMCSATSSGVTDLRTKKRRSATTSFNACRKTATVDASNLCFKSFIVRNPNRWVRHSVLL